MAQVFFDPLHIGHVPSLIIATVSDGICSLLILFGMATRWACIYVFCNVFVAWALCHHFIFWGRMVGDHGELIVLYLIFLIGIFIAGPGNYSVDALLQAKFGQSRPTLSSLRPEAETTRAITRFWHKQPS